MEDKKSNEKTFLRINWKDNRIKFAIFCLLLVIAIIIGWILLLLNPQTNFITYKFEEESEAFGPITPEHSFVEKLSVNDDSLITELSIKIATYGRINNCQVDFVLYRNSEEVFRDTIEDASSLSDNAEYTIENINVPITPEDDFYLLITSPNATIDNSVTVWTSDGTGFDDLNNPAYTYDTVTGTAINSSKVVRMLLTTYNDTKVSDLATFQTAIVVALTVFSVLILVLLWFTTSKIEQITTLAVFLFGLLYMLVITPLSGPDEIAHYLVANSISNQILFREDGSSNDFDFSQYKVHQNVATGYLRLMEEFNDKNGDTLEFDTTPTRSYRYFVYYIPQITGIILARILNLNPVKTFLSGRLFNLLFYMFCVYFSVKRTPKFKLLLSLICLSPMALQQAATLSYDGFVNGMAFLLIASIIKAIYDEGKLSLSDYLWILITAALLAPTKVVYIAILLLTFLIPAKRFGGIKQKLIGIGILFALSFLLILLVQYSLLSVFVSEEASNLYDWEGYSIKYILANPVDTAVIFIKTLNTYLAQWFEESIGSSLSGLTLKLPEWIILSYGLLLGVSAIQVSNTERPFKSTEISAVVVVSIAVVLMVMLSMFIGWTSVELEILDGIQGRYFTPILPLIFMALNSQYLTLKKPLNNECLSLAVILQVFVITQILLLTGD